MPDLGLRGCKWFWLLALASCEGFTAAAESDAQALHAFGVAEQRRWDDLRVLKDEVLFAPGKPVVFTNEGHGAVEVRRWFLEGGPDWEYVRAKFTYDNTTTVAMEYVDVVLSVIDGGGRTVAASRVRLTHPWGLPLAPGSSFADEITAPTRGAHWDRGCWRWRIDVEATPVAPVQYRV